MKNNTGSTNGYTTRASSTTQGETRSVDKPSARITTTPPSPIKKK